MTPVSRARGCARPGPLPTSAFPPTVGMAGTGAHSLARAEHFVWLTARVLEQRVRLPLPRRRRRPRRDRARRLPQRGRRLRPRAGARSARPRQPAAAHRCTRCASWTRSALRRSARGTGLPLSHRVSTTGGRAPGAPPLASAATRRPPGSRSRTTRPANCWRPDRWWGCCTATTCGTPGCSGRRTSAGRRSTPWSTPIPTRCWRPSPSSTACPTARVRWRRRNDSGRLVRKQGLVVLDPRRRAEYHRWAARGSGASGGRACSRIRIGAHPRVARPALVD